MGIRDWGSGISNEKLCPGFFASLTQSLIPNPVYNQVIHVFLTTARVGFHNTNGCQKLDVLLTPQQSAF